MRLRDLHSWDVSVQEARDIQRDLAPTVSSQRDPRVVGRVAGLDISSPDGEGIVRGAVVVLGYPDLEILEVCIAESKANFPYVPGLLSFREAPVLLMALEKVSLAPDLIIVDGQGLAHPRRFGLACHIGLLTDTPTIGCAKSRLLGEHDPLGERAGSRETLVDRGEVVGAVLRTRQGIKPVFVSVGHRIDLDSAVQWVLACCRGVRLPQTTRLAHRAAAGDLEPWIGRVSQTVGPK